MSYRGWLLVAIALFTAGIILGLVTPANVPSFVTRELGALQELSRVLVSLPPVATALLIWGKNASALLLSFMFSPVLCLVPLVALAANGWLLGWVSAMVIEKDSWSLLLAGVLPHGVLEIPAFIIGEAAALSFGSLVLFSLFSRETRSRLRPHFKKGVKYLLLALALLVPAAFIEAFITPMLIR